MSASFIFTENGNCIPTWFANLNNSTPVVRWKNIIIKDFAKHHNIVLPNEFITFEIDNETTIQNIYEKNKETSILLNSFLTDEIKKSEFISILEEIIDNKIIKIIIISINQKILYNISLGLKIFEDCIIIIDKLDFDKFNIENFIQKYSYENKKIKLFEIDDYSVEHWKSNSYISSRNNKNIFLPQKIKDDLFNDVANFLSEKNKQFYLSHDIPYKRIYLFYGLPEQVKQV